jgi:hypothetical protein
MSYYQYFLSESSSVLQSIRLLFFEWSSISKNKNKKNQNLNNWSKLLITIYILKSYEIQNFIIFELFLIFWILKDYSKIIKLGVSELDPTQWSIPFDSNLTWQWMDQTWVKFFWLDRVGYGSTQPDLFICVLLFIL